MGRRSSKKKNTDTGGECDKIDKVGGSHEFSRKIKEIASAPPLM